MTVEFLEKFSTDLDDINSKTVKRTILNLIARIEAVDHLGEISHVTKLKGHRSAYRIRVGSYRVGLFLDGETVTFARVVHRKNIYRIFP